MAVLANGFIPTSKDYSCYPPALGVQHEGSVSWLKLQTWSWEGDRVLGVKNSSKDLLCLLLSTKHLSQTPLPNFILLLIFTASTEEIIRNPFLSQ